MDNSNTYSQLRKHLLSIGIDLTIVEYIDTLEPTMQEDIALLYKAMANDELLLVIALRDLDFVEKYIHSKKKEKLLQ